MVQYISNFLQGIQTCEIVSYFIGLVSILIAIISYVKTNRKHRPQYIMRTARLRSSFFENTSIEIKQGDSSIQELSVSMIAIWNKGTTIKREDVASKVPLQIVAPANAEILEIQLLYTDEANNIQYTFSDNRKKIIIDFEYLAKNEGVVMKLFHTCGEKESLKVHCALRSGIKISHSSGIMMSITRLLANNISVRSLRRFIGVMILLLCIFEIIMLLFSVDLETVLINNEWVRNIQLILYILLLFYSYRLFFYRKLPKKLADVYFKE